MFVDYAWLDVVVRLFRVGLDCGLVLWLVGCVFGGLICCVVGGLICCCLFICCLFRLLCVCLLLAGCFVG